MSALAYLRSDELARRAGGRLKLSVLVSKRTRELMERGMNQIEAMREAMREIDAEEIQLVPQDQKGESWRYE